MKKNVVNPTNDCCEKEGMNAQLISLQDAKLFQGVHESEFDQMLYTLDSQVKHYRKGQILIKEGMPITRCGLLLEGCLHAYQTNFWDEKTLLTCIHVDEIFCEALACSKTSTSNVTIEAMQASVVLWFDVHQIMNLEDEGQYHAILAHNLMQDIAQKNILLYEKINHMQKATTRQKLLSYLSLVASRKHSHEFDIEFNRQELADYLSVERSAMSNELSKLVKDGYLETRRNHFILKKDPI